MATIDTIADRSTGSAIAGKAYFETSTNKFIVFNGTAWIELDSDGVGAVYENRWGASFDGSDNHLDCGNDSSLAPANMTVSVWFKASGTVGTYNYIMSKSGAQYGTIHLRYTSANKFNIFLGFNSGFKDCTFNTAQTLTDWHHVAATYDGSYIKGYVDGSEDFSLAETGSLNYTANADGDHLWIGRGAYPDKAEGLIDEAAIFSTALSAADITKIYNSGVPTDLTLATSYDTDRTANLKGYWRMGDDSSDTATSGGSIATITDSSGNGNDATQITASKQPTFKALAQSSTSVSFDGSDGYLEIPFDGTSSGGILTADSGDIDLAISIWFKPSGGPIFSWGSSRGTAAPFFLLTSQSSTGTTYYAYFAGGYRKTFSSSEIVVGSWNHWLIRRTASNNTWDIFCNGNTTPVVTHDDNNDGLTSRGNAQNLYVSTDYYGYGENSVDEFAVFNTALSTSDISSLAASRGAHIVNDLSLSPVAYHRMGEDDSLTDGASVSQITDASGNGNHATQSTAANQPTASIDPVMYV